MKTDNKRKSWQENRDKNKNEGSIAVLREKDKFPEKRQERNEKKEIKKEKEKLCFLQYR